jgi:hypothetical protein
VLGRWGQGGGQDLRPPRAADGLGAATAGPVSQLGGESLARIALAPGDHGRARYPESLGDLGIGDPFGGAGKTPVEELISLVSEPSQVLSIANFTAGQAGARVSGGGADSRLMKALAEVGELLAQNSS